VKPRATTQRRRRGICVESRFTSCQSSVGAPCPDAAPTGLVNFFGARNYKDIAPTVLPSASELRLVAEVDALKRLQAGTAAELDTLLDRAWTHSLPARSGFALLLRKMLLTRSQLARIKEEL
jgi:hypothetical protein